MSAIMVAALAIGHTQDRQKIIAAIILNLIVRDGKGNWSKGVMVTAVYVIIAIGFFFIS